MPVHNDALNGFRLTFNCVSTPNNQYSTKRQAYKCTWSMCLCTLYKQARHFLLVLLNENRLMRQFERNHVKCPNIVRKIACVYI